MSSITRTLSLSIIAFVLSLSLTGQQAYYVSPAGSNGAAGTSLDNAWETIGYGLATIAPGDTLLVADGLYVETNLKISQISTADKPTVVKSINQWGAKIEGTTQYATILAAFEGAHIVIDGFEVFNNENRPFQDWNSGIDIRNSHHVEVRNNYVHDCGCGGIGGRESDYMIIRRNVTRDNAKTNPYNCSGISIYQPVQIDDEPGTHILISENVCFENECRLPFTPAGFDRPTDGNGIILDDFNQTQSFDGGPLKEPFTAETIVENNLSFNNGGAGMKAYEVANAIFRNNTSVNNNLVLHEYTSGLGEIAAEFTIGDVAFHNNIAVQAFGQQGYALHFQPKGGEATLDVRSNVVVGDVLYRRNPTLADNQVTNYDERGFTQFAQILPDDFSFTSVDDFRQYFGLRAGSPGLNAGDNTLAPATDLNGNPRPADGTVDIGAFEGAVEAVGPVADRRVLERDIRGTDFPVEVDGVRDVIYAVPAVAINRETFGNVSNDNDLSANWVATWDDNNLYFQVDVRDSRLHNDSANPAEDDSVEVFIDADNSRGDSYDGVNDFHFILGWNDDNVVERSRGATEGVQAAQRSSFTGYSKEISIPWTTLGVTPGAGMRLGLDFRVNDDDNDGAAEGRLAWQARENEAPTTPAAFGAAALTASAPVPAVPGVASGPLTVDGLLEGAWEGTTVHEISNLIDGEANDDNDFSATWRSKWTSTFLYLFVSVTDDEQRMNSPEWYNDDAVELYFDMGLERGSEYDDNDRHVSITYGTNVVIARSGSLGRGTSTTIVDTDKGYDVEVRIPWSGLGFTPSPGRFFGLDVQVNDDDNSGRRDAKFAWRATEDVSDEDPSTLGMVVLSEANATATFDPAVASTLTAFPNPVSGLLTLDLDEVPSTVTVIDLQGREVLRAAATRQLDLGDLPAASYLVTATTRGGIFRTVVVKE